MSFPDRRRAISSLVALGLLSACGTLPDDPTSEAFARACEGFSYTTPPVVAQRDRDACGAACVSSLLAYWGRPVSVETLKLHHPVPKGGYSMAHLQDMLISNGLHAVVLRLPPTEAAEHLLQGRPLLCATRMNSMEYGARLMSWFSGFDSILLSVFGETNHFTLLTGRSEFGGTYVVMDPKVGYRKILAEEYDAWRKISGYAVLLAAPIQKRSP